MNKAELLEYLGAVCDTENTIYSCNEMIALLENQKRSIAAPCQPAQPYRTVHSAPSYEMKSGSTVRSGVSTAAGIGVGVVLCIILCAIFASTEFSGILLILSIVAAFLIPIKFGKKVSQYVRDSLDNNHKAQLQSTYEQQADVRYQQAQQQYSTDYHAYLEAKKIYDAAINALDQRITVQRSNIARFKAMLEKLYSQNVIYPSFHDIVAVNQLREYIAMGLCDTLEGTTGAYSQYMQDVRINRICSSIEDMKKQLTSAIHASQNALLHEMRATNDRISDMNISLSTSVSTLSSSLHQYQQAINQSSANVSACLSTANQMLRNIETAANANTHNQYVAAREAGIQGYLLRLP